MLHLGYVDYADLPYICKIAKMLVMPTLFESISIPIYETFALKVPVYASNVVALPEQAGDAGLLFDPNDIEDIAQKILMYLDSDNLRIDKIKKALNDFRNIKHEHYKQSLLKMICYV